VTTRFSRWRFAKGKREKVRKKDLWYCFFLRCSKSSSIATLYTTHIWIQKQQQQSILYYTKSAVHKIIANMSDTTGKETQLWASPLTVNSNEAKRRNNDNDEATFPAATAAAVSSSSSANAAVNSIVQQQQKQQQQQPAPAAAGAAVISQHQQALAEAQAVLDAIGGEYYLDGFNLLQVIANPWGTSTNHGGGGGGGAGGGDAVLEIECPTCHS
jgi:hypothetical protein